MSTRNRIHDIEHQWRQIKSAYHHILSQTFRTAEEQDYVHTCLLKIAANVINMILSGDQTLRSAVITIFGEEVGNNHEGDTNTYQQDYGDYGHNGSNSEGNQDNQDNQDNLDNNQQTNLDINSVLSLAELLFQNQRVPRDANTSTSLTVEELRNMFPLWNLVSSASAERNLD